LLLAEKDELLNKVTLQDEATEKGSLKAACVKALDDSKMVYDDFTLNGLMQIVEKTEDGKYIVKNDDNTVNLLDNHIADYAKRNPNKVVVAGGHDGGGGGGDIPAAKKENNSIASSVARAWGK